MRRQAIIWTNADPIDWRLYAALGGDELDNDLSPIRHSLPIALNLKNKTSRHIHD